MESSASLRPSEIPWNGYESLNELKYSRVEWTTILDFQQFLSSCPWRQCYVGTIRRRRCPFRCQNCQNRTARPLATRAAYERTEEERERAAVEARELANRVEEEDPGLFSRDKLWFPYTPGVALIRGDLLVDVANFFSECDITVREHNTPTTNRSLQGKGWNIVNVSEDTELRMFFRPYAQLRVQIDKFYPPPDVDDLEHPGERVLCCRKGAHSKAMRMLLCYLGGTGKNEGGSLKIDEKCSYLLYSALGFGSQWKIEDAPFRMVRVPTEPVPDIYEIMLRLGLKRGKKRAKHFRENFKRTVRERKIRFWSYADLHPSSLRNVPAESREDEDYEVPDLTDSSEGSDVTDPSDDSGSEDLSGLRLTAAEEADSERRAAEAQAAHERKLAAEAAHEEELAAQAAEEEEPAESQAARLKRLEEATALRERRHALQAAREAADAAEAEAAGGRRHPKVADKDEESHAEAGESVAPGERHESEDNEAHPEREDIEDSGEETDIVDELCRGISRLDVQHPRPGGKE